MKKAYKVYVTDAYYICKDGQCDWATDVDTTLPKFESKHVETHDTLKAAHESMANWGSRWAMYSGVMIEDAEGSEVYSDYPSVTRCEGCKHEEWDRSVSDLQAMKRKDGKPLFPELV